jgi:hypothetical protein
MIRRLALTVLGVPEGLGLSRRLTFAIVGGIAALTVVVAVGLFWILGKSEKTARDSSTRFAAALVHDAPGAAPPGGRDYVAGVREYFGPVASARVIGAHNAHVNTGDTADTRSFFVTELLLRTERGPAVIEVEFDNHALFSDEVSGVKELEPDDAPALPAQTRKRLAVAYAARGGKPAGRLARSSARRARATGSAGARRGSAGAHGGHHARAPHRVSRAREEDRAAASRREAAALRPARRRGRREAAGVRCGVGSRAGTRRSGGAARPAASARVVAAGRLVLWATRGEPRLWPKSPVAACDGDSGAL